MPGTKPGWEIMKKANPNGGTVVGILCEKIMLLCHVCNIKKIKLLALHPGFAGLTRQAG